MLPKPEPGLVISYGYLWRHERDRGLEEGLKSRPCVIILAVEGVTVTVAPVTHRPPADPAAALEIPPRVKAYLGLDGERSWIVASEVNQFDWPGYDLRPIPGTKNRYDYGFLPPRLFDALRNRLLDLALKQRAIVERD